MQVPQPGFLEAHTDFWGDQRPDYTLAPKYYVVLAHPYVPTDQKRQIPSSLLR